MKSYKWPGGAFIALLAVFVFALTGCWQTSDGERAGIVTKFSKKGALWDTYEGELHYAGANGTIAADSWTFSIDASRTRVENVPFLVKQLERAQQSGERVKITYRQELISAPWRSETAYFIQSVEFVDPPSRNGPSTPAEIPRASFGITVRN